MPCSGTIAPPPVPTQTPDASPHLLPGPARSRRHPAAHRSPRRSQRAPRFPPMTRAQAHRVPHYQAVSTSSSGASSSYDQTTGHAHGRLHALAHLAGAERAAPQPRDELVPHGEAHRAGRAPRRAGATTAPGAARPRTRSCRTASRGAPATASTRSASPATSTRTVPPSRTCPATISRATGVSPRAGWPA
jgi:hypothetical protein